MEEQKVIECPESEAIAYKVATDCKIRRLADVLEEYEYEPSQARLCVIREIAGLLCDLRIISYDEYMTVKFEIRRGYKFIPELAHLASQCQSCIAQISENGEGETGEFQAPAEGFEQGGPLLDFERFGNSVLADLVNHYLVKSSNIYNEFGLVEIIFSDVNDFAYRLELRGIEKGT